MKQPLRRKGFTIVELVIVIAVIGVLSAILIPTFTNVIASAHIASAKSFVKNINTVLAINEAEAPDSKAATMHDAMEQGKIAGLDIGKQTLPGGYDFIFDEEARRFAIVTDAYDPNNPDPQYVIASDGEIKGRGPQLWKRYYSLPSSYSYSIYAMRSFNAANVPDLTVGFDEGEAVVRDIYYSRPDATVGQTVTFRTFGSNLHINAPLDTVRHYEWVNSLDVTAVSDVDCYEEYGYIQTLSSFDSGKFVAKETARFHESKETIETKLSGATAELGAAAYGVPFFDSPPYEADNHFIDGDYLDDEVVPDYDELTDSLSGVDENDLSGLYNAFASIGNNYTSHTKSYFNKYGARDYYRHYLTNYVPEKMELFTADAYYAYPVSPTYLAVCNNGLLNYNGNTTSFRLDGETLEARLGTTVVRGDLSLKQADSRYQDGKFTLQDLTAAYLGAIPFTRVSANKYATTDSTAINQLLEIIMPTFKNVGLYVIPTKVTIELDINESIAFRLRVYVSSMNSGALFASRKDAAGKPNWHLLLGEAMIGNIGTTTFAPAAELLQA